MPKEKTDLLLEERIRRFAQALISLPAARPFRRIDCRHFGVSQIAWILSEAQLQDPGGGTWLFKAKRDTCNKRHNR